MGPGDDPFGALRCLHYWCFWGHKFSSLEGSLSQNTVGCQNAVVTRETAAAGHAGEVEVKVWRVGRVLLRHPRTTLRGAP